MTKDKKAWRPLMKLEDKKKFKLAVRMIEDGVLEKFDDVALDDDRFKLNDVCNIIDESEVVAVKGNYIQSVV